MMSRHAPISEKLDVLDTHRIRTGEVLPKDEVHALGKIHRAVHLYLFDLSGQLLLQRRAHHVDHYPDRWSISVTGHVKAGESSSDAMRRELQEELGLAPTQVSLDFLFSFRQDAVLSSEYIDRQFNDVYVGRADFQVQDLTLAMDDVAEVQLVTWPTFQAMVFGDAEELAPVYARACKDVSYFLERTHGLSKAT